jgi:hypothetical protein
MSVTTGGIPSHIIGLGRVIGAVDGPNTSTDINASTHPGPVLPTILLFLFLFLDVIPDRTVGEETRRDETRRDSLLLNKDPLLNSTPTHKRTN